MPGTKWRRLLAAGSAAAVGIVGGAQITSALAATAAPTGSVLPSAKAGGHASKVIVMMKDYEAGLPARSIARSAAVSSEESSLVGQLRSAGTKVTAAGEAIPYLVADVTPSQRAALARNPQVQLVIPDVAIPNPAATLPTTGVIPSKTSAKSSPARIQRVTSPSICGSPASPEVDPEAITSAAINSVGANALGYTGAGVNVAFIAGNIDTTQPDFQRNPAYASAGSSAGSPVVSEANFAGEPITPTTNGGDAEIESFLDASSIAAQGNTTYDLNSFINSAHVGQLPAPCDIRILGAAPGASVVGLDVFSNTYDITESNFIQAIDYAVKNGVKVLNESFGSTNFPDTALDATRIADDDAVKAGVTVVVSSGDAGVTSTMGSPATDPNLISVGATTTFRSYEQDFYGGVNATTPKANNGTWIDNNISGLSSGGFSQAGNTVDLVAPGDLNWIECDPSNTLCTNENGNPAFIALSGGTSEAAPLTSAAAADVIQAYASTHHGNDPSPALIKQILVSTASDISAPANQQGAGLLNVLAAVKEAASIKGTTAKPSGGLLVSPTQINIVQAPRASSSHTISITNTGSKTAKVHLSTRALTKEVSSVKGSVCLNPTASSNSCGAPTTNSFVVQNGLTYSYQETTFNVPATTSPSRLSFSSDYVYAGTASIPHVALLDPSGAYSGFSLPQGLANYAHIEVANPKPGTWTAIFFTEQGSGGYSGDNQWVAATSEFKPAGHILPSTLSIPAGATRTATFTATSSSASGDTAQSIVLSAGQGPANTIPVTVRTTIPMGKKGATFEGVLTGGNGRSGVEAQTNSWEFNVPKGERDLDVSVKFKDKNNALEAFLLDPNGNAVATSTNIILKGNILVTVGGLSTYKDAPQAGPWRLVLMWLQPVSGSELAMPFTGAVRFNQVSATSNLPAGATLKPGKTYTYHVKVKNTGVAESAIFLDPRSSGTATMRLRDLTGSDQNLSLPLSSGSIPLYFVPTDTSGIVADISGSVPVTFDVEPYSGDPDLSPALQASGVTGSQKGDKASLKFVTHDEVMPGVWLLNPSEIGPYGPTGAPSATANVSFSAITRPFALNVTPSSGDLWTLYNGLTSGFTPVVIQPGKSATITLTIKVSGKAGQKIHGFVGVDNLLQYSPFTGSVGAGGDEMAALPFSYKIG